MKMHFNYVGIKGDSGKSLPLTGLDTVREHNVRDFCEEDPNFVLCREDQLIITLKNCDTILQSNFWRILLTH